MPSGRWGGAGLLGSGQPALVPFGAGMSSWLPSHIWCRGKEQILPRCLITSLGKKASTRGSALHSRATLLTPTGDTGAKQVSESPTQ